MERIPHLLAGAVEANVAQRPLVQVGVDPIGHNPLLGRAELSRPCQHAAAVDPYRETERFAILQGDRLTGEFRAAVEGHRRASGEIDPDAARRNAPRQVGIAVQVESVFAMLERQGFERRDGVHAAAG